MDLAELCKVPFFSTCDAENCTCDAWEPNENGNAYKCGRRDCGHYITRHKRSNEMQSSAQSSALPLQTSSVSTVVIPQALNASPANLLAGQRSVANRVFPGAQARLIRGGNISRLQQFGSINSDRASGSGLLASSLGLLPTTPTVGNRYQVIGKVPLQVQSKAPSSSQNVRRAPKATIEVPHALDVHLFPRRNNNFVPRGKKFSADFAFMEDHDLMKVLQIVHPCDEQQVDAAVREAFPILAGQKWNLLALDPSQPKSGRLGIVKLGHEEKMDSHTFLHYGLPPVQKSGTNRKRVYLAPAYSDLITSEESDEDSQALLTRKKSRPSVLDDRKSEETSATNRAATDARDDSDSGDELFGDEPEVDSDSWRDVIVFDDEKSEPKLSANKLTEEVEEQKNEDTLAVIEVSTVFGGQKIEETRPITDTENKPDSYDFPEGFVFEAWLKSPNFPNPTVKTPFADFRRTFLSDARRFYGVSSAAFVEINVEETDPVVSLLAWYSLASPVDLLRNPQICFRTKNVPNEQEGIDLSGMYREVLSRTWDFLMDYAMPGVGKLFVGDQMKMPTNNPVMQNADMFVAIGKMVFSCILHDASLPIYIEEYLFRYWMGFPLDCRILIQRNRFVAKIVAFLKYQSTKNDDLPWKPSTIPGLKLWLETHKINEQDIIYIPLDEFANQVVQYELIGQYTQAASHFYSGLNQVNFVQRFIESGSWLECEEIYFTVVTTSDEFLDKLNQPTFTGKPDVELRARVFGWFVEYVKRCDTDKLRELMRFITSMDRLGPRVSFEFFSAVDVEPGTLAVRAPRAHACAKQIDLCLSYAETEKLVFFSDIDYSLCFAAGGFGMQ